MAVESERGYRHAMKRLGAVARLATGFPRAGDLLLSLALVAAAQVEIWLAFESRQPIVMISSTLMTASIALRRLAPLLTISISATALAGQALLLERADAPFAQFVAFFVATYSVAAHSLPRGALLGGAVAVASVWISTAREDRSGIDDYAFAMLIVGGSWLAGWALRERRIRVSALEELALRKEQERDEKARAAVADERARIARELHDIVSHSLSVISIQTQAVRRRLGPEHEHEVEDLRLIETAARQAMAEMRRLFGVLRADRDQVPLAPQPGLGQLESLLEHTRAAGLPVELRVDGEAVPLPAGVDLVAYRVVQEALTNSLRHAGPAHASVLVRYSDSQLEIQVEDDGTGQAARATIGGHGLLGMRARIDLYGGAFESGDRPGGGFLVRARLPLREDAC